MRVRQAAVRTGERRIVTSAVPYWRLSSFYFFYFSLLGATAPFLALYFHHLGFPARASASWWRFPC